MNSSCDPVQFIAKAPNCIQYYETVPSEECIKYISDSISVALQKIATSFLEGETTVESFLEEFAEARKLAHMRRVKVDKMTELLTRRNQRAPPGAVAPLPSRPAPPAPLPQGLPYGAPSGAPYPTGHFAMPMPFM